MLRSKANAALERLKEFDKKYKLKQDKNYDSSDSIFDSRVSSTSQLMIELQPKEMIGASLKSKLDIRISDAPAAPQEPNNSSSNSNSNSNSNNNKQTSCNRKNQDPQLEPPSPEGGTGLNNSGGSQRTWKSSEYSQRKSSESSRTLPTQSERESKNEEDSQEDEISICEDISSASDFSRNDPLLSTREKINKSYRSDTFEDVTSSSGRSRSDFLEKEQQLGDNVKEKQVIELISPKPVQSVSECEIGLDEHLSDYVKIIEALDQDATELAPITLFEKGIKHSEGTEKRAKPLKQRKTTKRESDSQFYNKKEKSVDSASRKSSNEAISSSTKSSRSIQEENRLPEQQYSSSDNDNSIRENQSVQTVSKKDHLSEKSAVNGEEEEVELRGSGELLQEKPVDETVATEILRKLNREAINAIAKRQKVSRDKPARRTDATEEDSLSSPRKSKTKRGKQYSRSSNVKYPNSRKDEKYKLDKVDSKEALRRESRLIALKLQQEREDLRNFLRELDKTHFLNGSQPISKAPVIRALRLPNIESYEAQDLSDAPVLRRMTDVERLGEKVCEIRQWLKDQYNLYQEYSKLAQIVNAKYVPSNLEDAKETIRQLKTRSSQITSRVN